MLYIVQCRMECLIIMYFSYTGQWAGIPGGGGNNQQGGDILSDQTAPAQLPSIRAQQQSQGFPQNFPGFPQQNNLGTQGLGERGQMLLLTNGAASVLIANRDRLPRDRVRRVGVPVSLIRAFAIQPEVSLPSSLTANAISNVRTTASRRGRIFDVTVNIMNELTMKGFDLHEYLIYRLYLFRILKHRS